HAEDNAERRDRAIQAAASAPVRGPLKVEDVVSMVKSGVGDQTVINQIQTSNTRYNLDSDTIIWLKQNNVSDAVIGAMQDTNRYQNRRVVVRDPYYYERRRVVYVAPRPYSYYPPPPPVGVGLYARIR